MTRRIGFWSAGRQHLYLRLVAGSRSLGATGLPKTKANRERMGRIAYAVAAEIKARAFGPERYRHWFPQGRRAAEFRGPTPPSEPVNTPTLNEY